MRYASPQVLARAEEAAAREEAAGSSIEDSSLASSVRKVTFADFNKLSKLERYFAAYPSAAGDFDVNPTLLAWYQQNTDVFDLSATYRFYFNEFYDRLGRAKWTMESEYRRVPRQSDMLKIEAEIAQLTTLCGEAHAAFSQKLLSDAPGVKDSLIALQTMQSIRTDAADWPTKGWHVLADSGYIGNRPEHERHVDLVHSGFADFEAAANARQDEGHEAT